MSVPPVTSLAGPSMRGPESETALTIINPGTGELVGEVPAASPEEVDAAVRAAHAAQASWGRLGYSDRGQDPARVRRGVRGARRRARADPRRRAGQDDPRGEDRAAQGGRHARALRGHAEAGPRRLRPRARPRRRRPRAAPAARRRGGDRAVELPHHAAVQQARAGAAVRQHRRRQARRLDAAHDAAARGRSSPRPGSPRAC